MLRLMQPAILLVDGAMDALYLVQPQTGEKVLISR